MESSEISDTIHKSESTITRSPELINLLSDPRELADTVTDSGTFSDESVIKNDNQSSEDTGTAAVLEDAVNNIEYGETSNQKEPEVIQMRVDDSNEPEEDTEKTDNLEEETSKAATEISGVVCEEETPRENITDNARASSDTTVSTDLIKICSDQNSIKTVIESDETTKNDQKFIDESGITEESEEPLEQEDDQESSEENRTEKPVFVHVDTETEKDEDDKNTDDVDRQDDEFNGQPQEDPISSDDFAVEMKSSQIPMEEDEQEEDQGGSEEQAGYEHHGVDEEQGADEELCIVPDTERIISREEKEAAAVSLSPLKDPTETETTSTAQEEGKVEEKEESTEETAVENYTICQYAEDNVFPCKQCFLIRKPQFLLKSTQPDFYICDDRCLTEFKNVNKNKQFVVNAECDLRVKNLSSVNDHMVIKVPFRRKCVECDKEIVDLDSSLSWETMEFCNELCLSKYQKRTGSKCANCQVVVRSNCMGKYCVRFGYDIRQFCSGSCLEEYKKGLKVCSYCQKDMSAGVDGFLAPVGDKGQFKDFCSQQCMEKYDVMSNRRDPQQTAKVGKCSVCSKDKPILIEYELDKKHHSFCGEPCFAAFKFVNNIAPGKCGMCRKYFDSCILEEHAIFYDNAQHSFCSKSCQNIYIIAHRKIVPCSWCKVKKYNFDMIKRTRNEQVIMMCSLNCLSIYQVSLNAVHSKKVTCDHCQKTAQPMYHLTMSDATIRNFCSYDCVMTFQNQFSKTITFNEPEEASLPVPTSAPRKSKKNSKASERSTSPTIPIISRVESLAPVNGSESPNNLSNGIDSVQTVIKQHIIIKPTPVPPQRNVATMCKTICSAKSVNCKPNTSTKEIQTDEIPTETAIVPIPVPIYVPAPMWMYSMPYPVPFPFPLPIPVPIFIPTTRNSATGIMKEIKKIQVKIPTDPFEAELLMMAEMVAEDKKEENTDSESDEEEPAPADEGTFSPEPVDASNTFGDDVLQMALKMASELDEPAVDLEGALTASTITASQVGETAGTETVVDDQQPIHHMTERQPSRGRKRPGRPPKTGGSIKRGRRSSNQMDIPMVIPVQPPPPTEPIEKPDANMCLKYTFGVNAWKQWVTTKNAELEKSSRRVKLFKPEILQLTADELNYSLCLFVKEVRKPNGQEYAPDTIYYLCLGIQQYLFENSRIDNIFCDSYYEKFTDCLDEVAKKFSVLYNDSHYIVTRVEEEHLWESKQLGAHSPHVLLSTLMFFNTKHFNLTTVDEHMQLSFSHIMKHWKRNPNQPGSSKIAGSRNVLLRFYPPQNASDVTRKKKVYEQQENEENPLRCPVKLYEFYLSKCPESVKTRNDVFYLLPERSCVPDSPVWYSTMPLPRNSLEKMLHRVKMVKEINVALLTS